MYSSVANVIRTNVAIGSATSVMSADIAGFLGDATALIDAKLAARYPIPVVPTPPLLTMIETDIAIYRLMTRRLLSGEAANTSPWPDRYKESMELLDQIAVGSLSLTTSGDLIVATATGMSWSSTQGYVPTCNEDSDLSWQVDPDKLDDILGDRQ